MHFISGRASELGAKNSRALFIYRHKIFVESLKWPLSTDGCHEIDQFDRDDTIYVLAKNEFDHVRGVARLLPTMRPYLLQEVFPELMSHADLPQSERVWELSRFATSRPGEFNSIQDVKLATRLLTEAINCACQHGARQLVMVTSIAAERLMHRAGFCPVRVGLPKFINGEWVGAFVMDIPGVKKLQQARHPSALMTPSHQYQFA